MPTASIASRSRTSTSSLVVGGCDLLGALGECLRGELVRRQVLQVAGAVGRVGGDQRRPRRARGRRRPRQDQTLQAGGPGVVIVVVAGAIAVEAVGGEDRALDERRGRARSCRRRPARPRRSSPLEARGPLRGQRGGDPQALGIDVVGVAESDDEGAGRPLRVEEGELLEAGPRRRRRRRAPARSSGSASPSASPTATRSASSSAVGVD